MFLCEKKSFLPRIVYLCFSVKKAFENSLAKAIYLAKQRLKSVIYIIGVEIKMKKIFVFVLFLALLPTVSINVMAQQCRNIPVSPQWNGDTIVPYTFLEQAYSPDLMVTASLVDVEFAPLDENEMRLVEKSGVESDFVLEARIMQSRDDAYIRFTLNPVRNNNGVMEKLVSANIEYKLTPKTAKASSTRNVTNSVLASGRFYKLAIPETGIYRLSYSDLSGMGVDVASVNPRNLRVYHNGGGVLPELNSVERYDDLVELPVFVSGEEDGRFDQGDYALFYARGPVTWRYSTPNNIYEHKQNAYDDYAYAFVTFDKGAGKRITTADTPSGTPSVTLTEFKDYAIHESDEVNLAHAGRAFYGDKMDGTDEKTFQFNFPNLQTNRNCIVNMQLAGYNVKPASFAVYANGTQIRSYAVEQANSPYVYGQECGGRTSFNSNSDAISLRLRHIAQAGTTSTGYVDYITINAWRKAVFTSGQMMFRNPEAADETAVYAFKLSNTNQNVQIWDVTDPVNPKKVVATASGNVLTFKFMGNINNEFVAFDASKFLTPLAQGEVANQNLHSKKDVDFLIVTYEGFKDQAQRLKQFHAEMDPDLSVYITTPENIYNEFSCGAKDVTAIRDFARHLYNNSSPGRKIRYMLLLGDASYDYKNRNGISDFVPAYETVSSLSLVRCFVSDTYYGFMDDDEGAWDGSVSDIGIGRFPVTTAEQADYVIDKIVNYAQNNEQTMSPWRNSVTFWADDDEVNFMEVPEMLIGVMRDNGGQNVIVDKIYLDAYEQINTPSGQVSPAATTALNNRVNKGTLVLNYTGHGGEVQLTTEKVLQLGDVQSWHNAPKYPLMITATCEFSRYDDLNRTSLGEYTFMSRHGGMVSMFTTSRPTYRGPNTEFNKQVYKNLFVKEGGQPRRLGDVFRLSKPFGNESENAYVFFGDPAMRIAYPTRTVRTTRINGNDVTAVPDTLKALQSVTIEGEVLDLYGNKDESFNGIVHVSVYDKEADITTLGDQAPTFTFKLLNSQLFNGKTEVRNGEFMVSFIMPRDIAFNYGNGLISYYATDYEKDANGTFGDIIVGGFDDNAILTDDAPQLRIFIDDTLFVDGGTTNQNPVLLAFVNDKYGINTTGNGIGHDIVATLSGPTSGTYRLNEYFESEANQQGVGRIVYNFQNLAEGQYTLSLKVWNINNISNEAFIRFVVVNSGSMVVESPQNFPNPCTGSTSFIFGHNQTGNVMNVTVEVFNIMGQRIASFSNEIYGSEVRTEPIMWNCCTSGGRRLAAGVYPYRITATNEDGKTASCTSKLVILHGGD